MSWFDRFADLSTDIMGSSKAFMLMCALGLVWLGLSPSFGFSGGFQDMITNGLSMMTQLTAMLVLNTQNRHERAIMRATGAEDEEPHG